MTTALRPRRSIAHIAGILMILFGIFFTLFSPLYGGAIIIVAILILLMLRKMPKS